MPCAIGVADGGMSLRSWFAEGERPGVEWQAMELLSAQATAALLPYPALVETLAEVLRDRWAGTATAPPRQAVSLAGGGTLLLMPATDGELAVTKLVTVHLDNAKHGLPAVQADVVVLDARTGRRLFILDGATVTARRTAALSLLAARLLAPNPAGPLLIVGAGTQGRSHLDAFAEGLEVREAYIVSRTLAHAQALAEHARQRGMEAHALAEAGSILDRAKLIVTATTSTTPVLQEGIRPDAFVAAVGAYRPDMAELPPALVRRAQLYVDTLEGAQAEAGDLIQAGIDWSSVTPLEAALDAEKPATGPVVFKSVGHALWDLGAARAAARLKMSASLPSDSSR